MITKIIIIVIMSTRIFEACQIVFALALYGMDMLRIAKYSNAGMTGDAIP
jgi:hypothetical protein